MPRLGQRHPTGNHANCVMTALGRLHTVTISTNRARPNRALHIHKCKGVVPHE
jgi:hypothetical protein